MSRRDLAAVAVFAAAVSAINLGKPYHIDEPQFLAVAAQILRDPAHPLSFVYNWTGTAVEYWRIYSNPLLWQYLLAAALRATGGAEWVTRLLFLPVDATAACALYVVAARFLRRPLWPVLALVASPAWALVVPPLMAEKLVVLFGLWGLWSFLRGCDEDRPRWLTASAALLGLAGLSKYSGAALVAAALGYGWSRGMSWKRLLLFSSACAAPLVVYAALSAGRGAGTVAPVMSLVRDGAPAAWPQWIHRLRSLLCFLAGCGVTTAVAPFWTASRRRAAWAAAAAIVLFLPVWDSHGARALDRALGIALAFCAILALWQIIAQSSRSRLFWLAWMAPWAVLALGLYPLIAARLVLFLVLPCALALAEWLESQHAPEWLWPACAGGALALTLSLSYVDFAFARAQKELAAGIALEYPGRRVWFTGHWGLQYYLERTGAQAVDDGPGWERLKPGDVVVIPSVNVRSLPPARPLVAVTRQMNVPCAFPLRLIGGVDERTGVRDQAGFYSNWGAFLPYAISRRPLETYQVGVIQ